MTNAVYDLIVQSLSQKMSKIATETMLQAVLKEKGLTSDNVNVSQMQELLEGPLLGRLTAVLPADQAREQIDTLLQQLKTEFPKAPTLFTDVGAIWDSESGVENAISSAPQPWEDPFEFAEDDFEFDDPEYQTARANKAYDLSKTADQERIIQDLGRMQGVIGVMVARDDGHLLNMKAMREPTNMSDVIKTINYLFASRLKLMSMDLQQQVICLRPLGSFCVAVVASSQVNTGRLLSELQQIEAA